MQYLISTGDVVHHILPNGSSCPDATLICSREFADKIVYLLNDHARLDKGNAERQTDNSGSLKSLCPSCKSGDICDARQFVITEIDSCKRYRPQ